MRILIADDEALMVDFMARLLEEKRFVVKKATTIAAAQKALAEGGFDLIILDRNFTVEGRDGIELCREIRKTHAPDVPILILSAIKGSRERSKGLKCGADDYLEKPYDPVGLTARIEALLRRRTRTMISDVVGPFTIDREKDEILLHGKILPLKLKEFQLLFHFLSHCGRVIKENELLERVWNDDQLITRSNTVNVHLMRLRRALGKYGKCLKTIRGHGYIFELPPDGK